MSSKVFTAGELLTAEDVNEYLVNDPNIGKEQIDQLKTDIKTLNKQLDEAETALGKMNLDPKILYAAKPLGNNGNSIDFININAYFCKVSTNLTPEFLDELYKNESIADAWLVTFKENGL